MPNDRKHLQHIRTSQLEYVRILKDDIPVNASVQTTGSIPSQPDSSYSRYIQVTTNNWYYELIGKKPSPDTLKHGEIAVAFGAGFERIYLKNSDNTVIEFRPYKVDRYVAYMFQKDNDTIASSNGLCVWEIGYSELSANGVSPKCASVALREVSTGKQTVPDVVFDNTEEKVKIYIYSKSDIQSGAYKVIITGLNYGE